MRSSLGVLRRCALLAFVIAGATAAPAAPGRRAETNWAKLVDASSGEPSAISNRSPNTSSCGGS